MTYPLPEGSGDLSCTDTAEAFVQTAVWLAILVTMLPYNQSNFKGIVTESNRTSHRTS